MVAKTTSHSAIPMRIVPSPAHALRMQCQPAFASAMAVAVRVTMAAPTVVVVPTAVLAAAAVLLPSTPALYRVTAPAVTCVWRAVRWHCARAHAHPMLNAEAASSASERLTSTE